MARITRILVVNKAMSIRVICAIRAAEIVRRLLDYDGGLPPRHGVPCHDHDDDGGAYGDGPPAFLAAAPFVIRPRTSVGSQDLPAPFRSAPPRAEYPDASESLLR